MSFGIRNVPDRSKAVGLTGWSCTNRVRYFFNVKMLLKILKHLVKKPCFMRNTKSCFLMFFSELTFCFFPGTVGDAPRAAALRAEPGVRLVSIGWFRLRIFGDFLVGSNGWHLDDHVLRFRTIFCGSGMLRWPFFFILQGWESFPPLFSFWGYCINMYKHIVFTSGKHDVVSIIDSDGSKAPDCNGASSFFRGLWTCPSYSIG